MNTTIRLMALVLCSIVAATSFAYELSTHALLTRYAITKSVMATDASFLARLGLFLRPNALGERYVDFCCNDAAYRIRDKFENDLMVQEKIAIDPQTINAWIATGAIREDDVPDDSGPNPNPQDDPWNPRLYRVFHHFFDPLYNRGLDTIGTCFYTRECDIHKAPDWAIGSRDSFTNPNTPERGRNNFTVFNAREAMYRALTLKKQVAIGSYTPLAEATHPDIAVREATRKAYWATTFRSLGDILHLNQDMAQPQHTRNEPHSGRGGYIVSAIASGHASVYEHYVDARVRGPDGVWRIDSM